VTELFGHYIRDETSRYLLVLALVMHLTLPCEIEWTAVSAKETYQRETFVQLSFQISTILVVCLGIFPEVFSTLL
jgi:hypothetical protein